MGMVASYRTASLSYLAATGHLVSVAKYRRGVFNDEMLTRCEEMMRKVCEDFEAGPKEFNGERDHRLLASPGSADGAATAAHTRSTVPAQRSRAAPAAFRNTLWAWAPEDEVRHAYAVPGAPVVPSSLSTRSSG